MQAVRSQAPQNAGPRCASAIHAQKNSVKASKHTLDVQSFNSATSSQLSGIILKLDKTLAVSFNTTSIINQQPEPSIIMQTMNKLPTGLKLPPR